MKRTICLLFILAVALTRNVAYGDDDEVQRVPAGAVAFHFLHYQLKSDADYHNLILYHLKDYPIPVYVPGSATQLESRMLCQHRRY
jgi:hypothetical protein